MPPISPHNTATVDTAWSASDQEKKLKSPIDAAEARSFFAWYDSSAQDPNGDGWPDFKAGYKFGHHMVGDNGMGAAANMTACSAVVAILNGARGGTDIPATDKQGVWNHVDRHLAAGGKKAPPLGASAEESIAFVGAVAMEEAHELGEDPAEAAGRAEEALDAAASDMDMMPLALVSDLWAMRQDALPRLLQAARAASRDPMGAKALAASQPVARTRQVSAAGGATQRSNGAVAVVPLCGVITPRSSFFSMLFGGGGGLMSFREEFMDALTSPDVGSIVLDVDSPGGRVSLVPETAQMVFEARGEKPIIAVVNTMCASAAYWIASQADEIVATPSGEAGSIGVYRVHDDLSGMNARLGIEPTYIKAGKYKADGNPDEPLSDDAKANWQQQVDDLYAMFCEGVGQGRGVTAARVQAGYGEGRCLIADRALEAGLVDKVATMESVLGGLLGSGDGEGGPSGLGARAGGRSAGQGPLAGFKLGDGIVLRQAADGSLEAVAEATPAAAPAPAPAAEEDPDDDDDDEDENDDEPEVTEEQAAAARAAILAS